MRVHGWEERLLATVAAHRDTPFAWERGGCLELPLACIEAVTGENPMPGLSFGDAKDARRMLKDMGAAELEYAITARLEPVSVARAQRGDIGVVIHQGIRSAVVCIGADWIGKTETGSIRVPRGKVLLAFKV